VKYFIALTLIVVGGVVAFVGLHSANSPVVYAIGASIMVMVVAGMAVSAIKNTGNKTVLLLSLAIVAAFLAFIGFMNTW